MKNKDLYVITTESNMHVGSGDVNFGVIDNLIQRDLVTGLPSINSSGLKGAVREFFEHKCEKKNPLITTIFGSEPIEKDVLKLKQGSFRFFEANLLSIPVRSNEKPYLMATSPDVVKEFIRKAENFNIDLKELKKSLESLLKIKLEKGKPCVFDNDLSECTVEDSDLTATYKPNVHIAELQALFGSSLVLMSHHDFSKICDNNHLPVIARNNLEDGRSKNLWYEQVLPRYSKFYFVLIKDGINNTEFDKLLQSDLVQIGANATIGYGFTRIKKVTNL